MKMHRPLLVVFVILFLMGQGLPITANGPVRGAATGSGAVSNHLVARQVLMQPRGSAADVALTPQSTSVSGQIITDTTWTTAGSPYLVTGDVQVVATATLTISPGVEVQFQQYRRLYVFGTLLANGSASQPITLTGETKEAGWWYGVSIEGNSTARNTGSQLSYVTIEYGGYGYANLDLYYATVNISNSHLRHSPDDGIYGFAGGMANVSDTSFTDNGRYPIYFTDGSMSPSLTRLSFSNNGTDAIALGGGTLTGSRTWNALGVPYLLIGDQTVPTGSTLTIDPGVEMQFQQYRRLHVLGTLLASGSASQPITLTGSTKQPGWWYGVSIEGNSTARNTGCQLSYATIEYGGYGYANLDLYYATVNISNSRLRHSPDDGIYGFAGGVANISDTSLSDNGRYPIYFTDGSMNPALARLTFTNNVTNVIALGGGTLTGSRTWKALGVPYLLIGDQTVPTGSTLTIAPDVEVQFQQYRRLHALGTLLANGTASQPITLTGSAKQPGWWYGVSIEGNSTARNTGSQLSHVTIEYGGYSHANLDLYFAQAAVAHSIIRFSGHDGIYAGTRGSAGSVLELSQVISNTEYGVRTSEPTQPFLAPNNWWGSASGPTADIDCNPGGAGSRVSAGVAFQPFLSSPGADPGPVAPSSVRILALSPTRWFAPADGISRIYVTVTLRDGTGQALPGRAVRLHSTLGNVTDGGITDVQGQTFAYVRSNTVGEAEITAELDAQAVCESARSAITKVSFTSTTDGAGDLLPESAAPYLNEGIEIEPMPIVRGVRTVLRARLTNPNNFPILVDALFGFAQSGIGLTFGPVGQVTGQRIAANSTGVIEVVWTPLLSGHYCVQFEYSSRQDTGSAAHAAAPSGPDAPGSGRAQRNLNVYPGPLGSPNKNDSLDKADKAFKAVSKIPSGPTQIQKALLGRWWNWVKDTARKISQGMGGDPPRQDYQTIATLVRPNIPATQPGGQISAARAAALNAVNDALADVVANGNAAVTSFDRYGGAAAASDLEWSSQQAAAQIFYTRAYGEAMISLADRLDAFMQVLQTEGAQDFLVSADDIRAYQDRLRTQGFTADEINDARQVGLSDAEIEAIRQDTLATDPESVAGSYFAHLADESAKARKLGDTLLNPWDFGGGLSISGGAGAIRVANASNNLARVYETESSIQVGNPLTQTATIVLSVRRVDMPADWLVSMTPMTVTLAPGERTTVTVRIAAGTATVQGTRPRVALEGSANGQLLGGVVMDVVVPTATFFDGKSRVYLPLLMR